MFILHYVKHGRAVLYLQLCRSSQMSSFMTETNKMFGPLFPIYFVSMCLREKTYWKGFTLVNY